MTAGTVLGIHVSKGGVPKLPVPQARVTPLGLEGDLHAHPEIHGGPQKALLWITSEGLEELKTQGFPLYFGALGENVTSRGIDRRAVRLGQRWRIGEVIIELTRIRKPCATIDVYGPEIKNAIYDSDIKAGSFDSPRWGLSGFYAAIVRTGSIREGDAIELLEQAG